eukprot:CAMPEP_0183703430 /NCGR_PEP_ID=MMETSP0737-20130205/1176_1 /TAXON_ID=385413 /ORGANISM="Thalassiosira miniscula, Strain CCMP1093" /LENGTH=94 /DNA_ID=CAMNT_0025930181 /DNA_START=92 /DNA_END=376 /DNA_ORIENTATION=+
MQEVAALLLCKLGGKSGSADEIKEVIAAAGGEPNEDQIAALVGDLDGKDVNELLAAGMGKLKDAAVEEEKEAEEEVEEAPPAVDMFGGGDDGDY